MYTKTMDIPCKLPPNVTPESLLAMVEAGNKVKDLAEFYKVSAGLISKKVNQARRRKAAKQEAIITRE